MGQVITAEDLPGMGREDALTVSKLVGVAVAPMIRRGDRITVKRCGGGRATYDVSVRGAVTVQGSGPCAPSDHVANIISINGRRVNPYELALIAIARGDVELSEVINIVEG